MRNIPAICSGVVIGILIGATVSFASGGRDTFENLSKFLSTSRTFQQAYTAGVWDTLVYLETDTPITPEEISSTLNCMDNPTLGIND